MDENSRLAWCYGDLGIAYTIYQASKTFKNIQLTQHAYKILIDTTKRKTQDNTLIFDAGICHGTSGVAHFYYRLWKETSDIRFKSACDYWIKNTIQFLTSGTSKLNLKMHNPVTKEFENAPDTLLEGSPGIGLALISHLTGFTSWDYCIII